MILRIEKHFKAEQAARKKAEELLQQAIAAEMEAKNKLEEVLKRRGQEQGLLEEERAAIKRVRGCLWFLVFGFWFLVFWFLVFGFWFLVFGFWFWFLVWFLWFAP